MLACSQFQIDGHAGVESPLRSEMKWRVGGEAEWKQVSEEQLDGQHAAV